jgi:ferric-dicitrate binding protein FerR (iron transport regulator)
MRLVENRPKPGSVTPGQARRQLTLVHLTTELARGQTAEAGPGPDSETDAVSWFVRFNCDPLELFDWAAFEGWVREQPAHRLAYDRIEQLWYSGITEEDDARRRGFRRQLGSTRPDQAALSV